MQHLNNDFNKFKVKNSIHTKMLITQKMWKNSLNQWNIITKYWLTCILEYYSMCKMQFVGNLTYYSQIIHSIFQYTHDFINTYV